MTEKKSARRRLAPDAPSRRTVVVPAPGTVLDSRWELVEELGRGGMGVVFRAYDRELEMPVAVKVLPPELAASKRAIKDIKREAVLAMKLRHPGIMALYHFAYDGDAKFLVMELLSGCSLDDILAEEETISLERLGGMARQLAEALDYAHGERIVHRDIKPANIFVGQSDRGEIVKLMDFGIARQIKDTLSRISRVESSGTLLYMSPEQLQGKNVDARADIYSFAATLYECLSGNPPFYQGNISYQVINVAPEAVEGLPEHVNKALLQALSKSPDDRQPTAKALVEALLSTPGADTSGAGTPGADTPGADTSGAGTPGADTSGAGTPGADTSGAGTPGADTPGADTPGSSPKSPPRKSCLRRTCMPLFIISIIGFFLLFSCSAVLYITDSLPTEEDILDCIDECVDEADDCIGDPDCVDLEIPVLVQLDYFQKLMSVRLGFVSLENGAEVDSAKAEYLPQLHTNRMLVPMRVFVSLPPGTYTVRAAIQAMTAASCSDGQARSFQLTATYVVPALQHSGVPVKAAPLKFSLVGGY